MSVSWRFAGCVTMGGQAGTGPATAFFLADGDKPLDASVASVVEDMPEQIVTPLLAADRQASLGIPFSNDQTVVVSNLRQLVRDAEHICGRPAIIHVGRGEIDQLAETLLAVQDKVGTITLRLSHPHTLNDQALQVYEQQLSSIADISLMKQATGVEGRLNLLNLHGWKSGTDGARRCPAGTDFFVVGPDGRIYACPAFFYAGGEHALGTVDSIENDPVNLSWSRVDCGICGSGQCPGCPFLESIDAAGRENICRINDVVKFNLKRNIFYPLQSTSFGVR